MILVRNVFQVKFGKMKEARGLWKEGIKFVNAANKPRLLTDLTGPFYTLVLETTHKDVASLDADMRSEMSQTGWDAWYQKFIPLVDSGRREMYAVVE
ncbi:MAG: hypothetical protein ABSG38_04995 [Spirochaetia bacterium]